MGAVGERGRSYVADHLSHQHQHEFAVRMNEEHEGIGALGLFILVGSTVGMLGRTIHLFWAKRAVPRYEGTSPSLPSPPQRSNAGLNHPLPAPAALRISGAPGIHVEKAQVRHHTVHKLQTPSKSASSAFKNIFRGCYVVVAVAHSPSPSREVFEYC